MNALAPSMQIQPIDYVGLWHKSRLSVHDVRIPKFSRLEMSQSAPWATSVPPSAKPKVKRPSTFLLLWQLRSKATWW